MTHEWTGVIISGIALFLGLLGNIVATVWWASKITTRLTILISTVDELNMERKAMATKEELVREIAVLNKENIAVWKKIDYLTEAFDKCRINHAQEKHQGSA